jgi:hypothetical protein
MRGFQRTRAAGRSTGGGHTHSIKLKQQGFAFNAFEGHVGGVGQSLRGVAIYQHTFYLLAESQLKVIPQFSDATGLQKSTLCQLSRAAHGHNTRYVLGASPTTAFLTTPKKIRIKRRPLANKKGPDTLGRMHLMRGKGEEICWDQPKVDLYLARCLDSIGMKQHPLLLTDLSDSLHREQDTSFIIGPHDGDHGSVWTQHFPDLLCSQKALRIDSEPGDFPALALEVLGIAPVGIMFHLRQNQMTTIRPELGSQV